MNTPLHLPNHWLERARALLGLSVASGRDLDVEQALLRVFVTALVLAYAAIVGLSEGAFPLELRIAMACGLVTGSAGLWMLVRFRRTPDRTAHMRSFGIVADLIPITAGLFLAGEIGVPLVGLYLWITVGNGFRFGPRFLLQSYLLSGICFAVLLLFSPFWQAHRAIGIGLAILLATIPLYVLVLLSRLTAQKDAAEQLSNAKSRFVANVSHELRTPLTGVVAVHDLLLRRPLSRTDMELVGNLGSAIEALKTSVDAILQMSKLEAGAEHIAWQYFNLRAFLRQVGDRFAPAAKAKALRWEIAISDDTPGTYFGDPAHLSHIVGNLLNNAFKFTSTGAVALTVSRAGQCVRFEVTDTGIGIPKDKQANIFERFVQADASATRRFGGTGLGTSIAHDLVKLMGGRIGVDSAVAKGSKFWFELPFHSQTHEESRQTRTVDRRIVQVVSEGPSEATRIAQYIRDRGHRVSLLFPHEVADATFSRDSSCAVLLLLSASEALSIAEGYLGCKDRCPWLVVATSKIEPSELSGLWSRGASEVLAKDSTASEVWSAVVGLLPYSEPEGRSEARESIPRRVLVADDNQSNLALVTRLLEGAGHSVRAVERGDVAYDLMVSGQFDIALLDFNMPEMTGPDAVKLFRYGEAGTKERLPILIVSADATPSAERESVMAGADGHVTKPVSGSELLELVANLTAGCPARLERRATKRTYPRLVPTGPMSVSAPRSRFGECTNGTLLDPTRLSELQRISCGDSEFLSRYAKASFLDIEAAVAELHFALESGDSKLAREALHKIDGTSVNLGASAIARASANMKLELVDPMGPGALSAAAEIATTCAVTKSAMTAVITPAPSRSGTGRGN